MPYYLFKSFSYYIQHVIERYLCHATRNRIMRYYTKDLALRLSEEQRGFLERMAAIKGCGICEAARMCIGAEMRRGYSEC